MLLFRASPKCRGDVARVVDVDDTYYACLQCGLRAYSWPPQVVVTGPAG